ncbi:MAG: hypothetical protein IJY73_07525 [Oscillospiraceae bacterium]|nr:hypothetical protein [Oscillospiraceae bacterium]
MTTEQLNVIITAQTEDFQTKIAAVNASILETIALADQSASSVANIAVQQPVGKEKTAQADVDVSAGRINSAAATVLNLRSGQTLIGAVTGNNSDTGFTQPVGIHTTVELDGAKVGESVSRYNNMKTRIRNGF